MNFPLSSVLLDACVLGLLEKGDTYGYVLTQSMKDVTTISESTLYPVLRRLQKMNFLTTYDQPFQGRNRRYYSLTDTGKEKLKEYQAEWISYKKKIDQLLKGVKK